MKEIVILDAGYESYRYEQELFSNHGYQLRVNEGSGAQNNQQRIEYAGNAIGILVRGTRIGAEALANMPELRAIVRYGVGFDNIDVEAVKASGIRVANVQGYANHAVSDHALALMFACVRKLEGIDWTGFGIPPSGEVFELHDKILGIIGIGRIGSHFCKKAAPLFSETLACDPYQKATTIRSYGARKTELAELLERSHVISIHCNLTPETRYLLNSSSFNQMKNRPVIINTARGPVLHEKDLLSALDRGVIHSAGLDVYEQEPPGKQQMKLIDHPGVVATPHLAWYSDYSMKSLQKRAADNMVALLAGKQISDEL